MIRRTKAYLRWLHANAYDAEIAGYVAILLGTLAVSIFTGVTGPTLDAAGQPYPTCDGCGKTVVVAKE